MGKAQTLESHCLCPNPTRPFTVLPWVNDFTLLSISFVRWKMLPTQWLLWELKSPKSHATLKIVLPQALATFPGAFCAQLQADTGQVCPGSCGRTKLQTVMLWAAEDLALLCCRGASVSLCTVKNIFYTFRGWTPGVCKLLGAVMWHMMLLWNNVCNGKPFRL